MKILVIEDDADIASNIGQYFESKGYQLDFGYRGQNSEGYGVGLYISKLICDYQGWRLELAPNPEGGIITRIGFDD